VKPAITWRNKKNDMEWWGYASNIASNAKRENVTIEHLQVGHTHNSIDQCFSSTSSILARAPVQTQKSLVIGFAFMHPHS